MTLTSSCVGTTTEEREMNEQGQEGKGKEGEREAEEGDEEVGEGAREEEEEMEVGAGYIEVELEDEPPADELNLAKLFVEPNEYNNVSLRPYPEDLFSKPTFSLFED